MRIDLVFDLKWNGSIHPKGMPIFTDDQEVFDEITEAIAEQREAHTFKIVKPHQEEEE